MTTKFVSVSTHIKDGKIAFSTFIEDENLFIINNIGNKQLLLLGKDKSAEFDNTIENLKDFHKTTNSIEKIVDIGQIKENKTFLMI